MFILSHVVKTAQNIKIPASPFGKFYNQRSYLNLHEDRGIEESGHTSIYNKRRLDKLEKSLLMQWKVLIQTVLQS